MKNSKIILYCLSVFSTYIFLSIILYYKLIIFLYPIADEISLIQASNNFDSKWFLSGFSDYFIVYPEWVEIKTDYIRPVTNLLYWIFSPWNLNLYRLQLILTNYAFHASISTFIFYISYEYYKRKLNYSLAVSAMVYFCAAFFNSPMPYHPVFVIECISASLCVLAIYSYVNKKYVSCIILMFISLLTKESSLPIFGSLILYSIFEKNRKTAISLVSIIIFWVVLRYLAYDGFGNTATFSQGFRITNVVSTSMLPLAFFDVSTIKGFITNDDVPVITSFFLSINILFWCLFLFFVFRDFVNKDCKIQIIRNDKINNISILCMFTTTAYIAITGVSTGRFTYLFTLILALYLISVKNKLFIFVTLFLLCVSIIGSFLSFSSLNKDMLIRQFISSNELVAVIKKYGMNIEKIYIANDFSSGCVSPIYQKNFAGIDSDIIRITSIDSDKCSSFDINSIETSVRRENGFLYIDTKLPKCASFMFESTDMEKLNIGIDNTINRDNKIFYTFKDLSYTNAAVTGKNHINSLGQSAYVKLKEDNILIYYDFKNKKWKKFDTNQLE